MARDMRMMAIATFVVAIMLAGCADPEDSGVDPRPEAPDPAPVVEENATSPEGPRVLPWDLAHCRWVVPLIPAEADAVSEHLPEGFSPYAYEGLPAQPGKDATIGMELFQCESSTNELNGTVEQAHHMQYWAFVEPPADLEVPEADIVFYFWDRLVPDDDSRSLLEEAGLPVHDGETAVELVETPAGRGVEASMRMGDERAAITATGLAPEPGGFTYVGITQTPDGFAFREASVEMSSVGLGAGVVDASGTLFEQMLGASVADAYILAGADASIGGSLTLPA